ncbi:hypothetical protein BGZ58_001592, partial [Dissophora ornata]
MHQTDNTNDVSNTTISNTRPSIQFNHDDDTRGRDHVTHPISKSKPASAALTGTSIPLTKTATTDSSKSRRSVLSAFADRLRSRSLSHSRSRSRSKGPRSSLDANDGEVEEFKYSQRRSSEFGGGYADVARAQALFMEKLREEQAKNHITHN